MNSSISNWCKLLPVIAILLSPLGTTAQRAIIDTNTLRQWIRVADGGISDDGKYCYYYTDIGLNHGREGSSRYTLKTIDGKVIYTAIGRARFIQTRGFTSNGQALLHHGDTLLKLSLPSGRIDRIKDIRQVTVVNDKIICIKRDSSFQILDQNSRLLVSLKQVIEFQFIDAENLLVIGKNNTGIRQLFAIRLSDSVKLRDLGAYTDPTDFKTDTLHHQLLFVTDRLEHPVIGCVNYLSAKTRSTPIAVPTGMRFEKLHSVSSDGNQVCVIFSKVSTSQKERITNKRLLLYSYLNVDLPTAAEYLVEKSPRTAFSVDLENDEQIQITNAEETLEQYVGNFAVVSDADLNQGKAGYIKHLYLVDLRKRKKSKLDAAHAFFSSAGMYLLTTDRSGSKLSLRNLATGKSYSVNIRLRDHEDFRRKETVLSSEHFGWLKADQGFLLSDNFDIWQIDPTGDREPLNLTGDYGHDHQIRFSIESINPSLPLPYRWPSERFSPGETIVLNGFGIRSKDNGYYTIKLGQQQQPRLLMMGPWLSYRTDRQNLAECGEPIRKAKNAEVWLVARMNSSHSMNYEATSDFKTFIPVTTNYPERSYNWLTSELLEWKGPDAAPAQGILYKPQNFDPTKRYPVIVFCYERLSDRFHSFLQPELSNGDINIPWFVSRGYLVFTPDIRYTPGYPMTSALRSIDLAVDYISKLPYVDSMRLGLQGHSFGALETNYIITHSSRFAAACTASGIVDWVSDYGTIRMDGSETKQSFYEEGGQNRTFSTPWQRPDLFLLNSSVLSLHRVTTPLLIMHGARDGACDPQQAIQLFTDLRRLGKRAWLLMYQNEGHILGDPQNKLDYTLRMEQFFDHYLKGQPAPLWMTRDATQNLEFDENIKTPGNGLITEKEQGKIDSLKNRLPINISIQ